MQTHEFRKELQDAILRLQRIANKIDEDHLKEVAQNEVDAARNAAVAQARREIEAGVVHPDVTPVPTIMSDDPTVDNERFAENQRRVLEARQAAAKTKEK